MRFQETILEQLGRTFRSYDEGITREPLPRRWIDLILFLEEQERKRSEHQPEPEPQRR